MAENSIIEAGRCVYAKGFTISSLSEALTAAIVAASAPVLFSLRNIGPEELSIDRIDAEYFIGGAPITTQRVEVGVFKTTAHSSQPAGGTAVTALRKRDGDHALLDQAEVAITRIDANGFSSQGTATVNSAAPLIYLTNDTSVSPRASGFWSPAPGIIPHTLGPDEGIQARIFTDLPVTTNFRFFIKLDVRRH